MKKLLFFLFFPLIINAQITLTGSSIIAYQAVGYSCGTTQISVNGTYSLDGTFNGKNRYSMSVSLTSMDGLMCYNGTMYAMLPGKFYIRWSSTNNNWELGFNGQSGPNTVNFIVMSTVAGSTTDPPCGTAFGGTIAGASCYQNCTASMTVSGSTTICAGASTTLSATGCSGTVIWDNGGGTGASISVSPATTTTYTATCSTAGVCTGVATVTVNYAPPAPQIVAIEIGSGGASGTNISICAGKSIALYCGGCSLGGVTFNWSNGTTTNGNSSDPFIPVASSTYTATQTLNGCTSAVSNIVSVTVNPAMQITGNTSVCSGTPTTLTATGCSGTVTWNNSGGTGSVVSVSPTTTTTYTATCSTAGVCSASITINVTTTPNAPIITTSTPVLCAGSTATIGYNGCSAGSVLWSDGSSGFNLNVTSNGTYTASCVNGSCASAASNSITLVFHTTPSIAGATCIGSTLTATGFGVAPLQWFKDGIELTGATSSSFIPTQAGSYQVATTSSKGTWTSLTSPSNQSLNGVYFISAATGWVAGDGGKIYKTTDGGTTWTAQTSGITNSIKDIYFTNASQGFAVGSSGKILKTTDGGSTWTLQTSNTTNDLYDVFFLNATTGWAVGAKYIVLKTTDSGATWTTTSIDNAATTSDYYSQVQFIDATTGYVSGGKGDFSEGFVKKSIDGGATWTSSYSSGAAPSVFMFGLSFIDANTGWVGGAVQGSGPYAHKTTNAGSAWSGLSFAGLSISNSIRAIHFIDANKGWMLASNNFLGYNMLSTSDGGLTFSKDLTTNASQITSQAIGKKIFMLPDGSSGWMVGSNFAINSGYLMKFSNKVCTSNTVVINPQASAPTLNLTGTQTLCPNAIINLIASGCTGTITWSNNATGSTLTVNTSGTYSATCTTSCGTSVASTSLILTAIPASLPLSGTASNGVQQAGQTIVSTQTVNAGTNTTYRAGGSVTLNQTFQTQTGAVFKAEIGGCN